MISKNLMCILLIVVGVTVIILLKPKIKYINYLNNFERLSSQQLKTKAQTNFNFERNNIVVVQKKVLSEKQVKKIDRPSIQKVQNQLHAQIIQNDINTHTENSTPDFHYQYVGYLIEDNLKKLFFIGSNGAMVGKIGDTIDGTWRIDSANQKTVYMTYLPLNLKHVVAMR